MREALEGQRTKDKTYHAIDGRRLLILRLCKREIKSKKSYTAAYTQVLLSVTL